MRLLLTAGIKNYSIKSALASLLGKPISDADALVIPTAVYPMGGPDIPENSMTRAEKWATGVPVPGYAIDGQTAIKVVDGSVEVVSEGNWRLFES